MFAKWFALVKSIYEGCKFRQLFYHSSGRISSMSFDIWNSLHSFHVQTFSSANTHIIFICWPHVWAQLIWCSGLFVLFRNRPNSCGFSALTNTSKVDNESCHWCMKAYVIIYLANQVFN